MKKILLAAFALTTLVFNSCDTDVPKVDVSIEKALADDYWVITKVTQNSNVNDVNNTWYDITNSQAPCVRDDRYWFSKTNVIKDEYWQLCMPSDPQSVNYGYSIQNENYIKIFDPSSNAVWRQGDFKLESINKFTLDERITDPSTPDITVSTIYTYEKKSN